MKETDCAAMRLVVFLWLLFVTALSVAPFAVKYEFGTKGHFHDFGHFSIFVITVALFCWGEKGITPKFLRFLAACGFGILLEALEMAIYHNRFEWHDIAVDVAGAVIGFAAMTIVPLLSACFPR